jgi:hypothetical protein
MTRSIALLGLLLLAGCTGSPADFGITGPGMQPLPTPVDDDNVNQAPGVHDPGTGYGPSVMPSTTNGRFFNYN